jgi:uncharacterized protein YbjT (DUF2867 family)
MNWSKCTSWVAAVLLFGLAAEAFRMQCNPRRVATYPTLSMSASTEPKAAFKLLVLGGTGFVGREVVRRARAKGMSVVSISRRGKLLGETDETVTWISGDAAEAKTLEAVYNDFGPFDGCIHAVGLLLDAQTGVSTLNRFASGSGSLPSSESTFDRVIRQSGVVAVNAFTSKYSASAETPKPFVFISAAEAGWTMPVPGFLERYLQAKRVVEEQVMTNKALRPVILRPSLVWTWDRPQALPAVVPFLVASTLGVPFVDRPVLLATLVDAAVGALQDPVVRGILRERDMKDVAAKMTRIL